MDSERHLSEVLAELGLPATERIEQAASDDLDRLEQAILDWDGRESRTAPRGRWGDDEYNATLAMYECPRQNSETGPLTDTSVLVKDNIAVEGLRMTLGLGEFETVPARDATVVERVLDAGGQILGKANMDAFAFGPGGLWSERGRVQNPIDDNRVPGGTSSGCGAAVAAGLADAALGSDTGGSVRSPAACCGIVGIKPTHGYVSRYGLVENVPSTDTIGPLARDVETAARVLEVIRGPDHRDPTATVPEGPPVDRDRDEHGPVDIGVLHLNGHDVDQVVEAAIDGLAADLAVYEDVSIQSVDLTLLDVSTAYTVISGAEFAWLLRQEFTHRGGVPTQPALSALAENAQFTEHIAERILPGAVLDAETDGRAYALAEEQVLLFKRRLRELFETVDVLLTPTLRTLPPKPEQLRDPSASFSYTIAKEFSLAGVPAVSIPFAESGGLPISAQVLAPWYEDRRAITVARLVERLGTLD